MGKSARRGFHHPAWELGAPKGAVGPCPEQNRIGLGAAGPSALPPARRASASPRCPVRRVSLGRQRPGSPQTGVALELGHSPLISHLGKPRPKGRSHPSGDCRRVVPKAAL